MYIYRLSSFILSYIVCRLSVCQSVSPASITCRLSSVICRMSPDSMSSVTCRFVSLSSVICRPVSLSDLSVCQPVVYRRSSDGGHDRKLSWGGGVAARPRSLAGPSPDAWACPAPDGHVEKMTGPSLAGRGGTEAAVEARRQRPGQWTTGADCRRSLVGPTPDRSGEGRPMFGDGGEANSASRDIPA